VVFAALVEAAVLDEPGMVVADVGAPEVDDDEPGAAALVRLSHAVSPAPTATDADQARKFRREMVMIRPPQIRG
jgi:hypothetical protein